MLTDDKIAQLWPTAFVLPAGQRKTLLAFARAVEAAATAGCNGAGCCYAAAMAERDELDAARYRWLLANCALGIKQNGLGWSLNTRQSAAPESIGGVSAAIDAEIDFGTKRG